MLWEPSGRLGVPTMGIRVQEPLELGSLEYRAIVNGKVSAPRTVAEVTDHVGAVADHPDHRIWQGCIDLLVETVMAEPTAVFVPHTMESLLEEWREDGRVPKRVVERLGTDLGTRVRLWQRLRREVAKHGRLPDWPDGLAAIVDDVLRAAP